MVSKPILTIYQQRVRDALEDQGVPELIAFMAARNSKDDIIKSIKRLDDRSAGRLILTCFSWTLSREGLSFWIAVQSECVNKLKNRKGSS